MIIRKLSKGRPEVIRIPSQFKNLIVLEVSSTLSASCKKSDMHLAFFTLVLEVPKTKIIMALKRKNEIQIDTKNFLELIGSESSSYDFTVSNLEAIENETKFAFNFFMKKTNNNQYRTVYNRILRSKQDFEQLCILVDSREEFCANEPILICGLVLGKDISQRNIFFCSDCHTPCARKDILLRHTQNTQACSTETKIIPQSKQYGAKSNPAYELCWAGFIPERLVDF